MISLLECVRRQCLCGFPSARMMAEFPASWWTGVSAYECGRVAMERAHCMLGSGICVLEELNVIVLESWRLLPSRSFSVPCPLVALARR